MAFNMLLCNPSEGFIWKDEVFPVHGVGGIIGIIMQVFLASKEALASAGEEWIHGTVCYSIKIAVIGWTAVASLILRLIGLLP